MFWISMAITAVTSAVSINAQQNNARAQLKYNKDVQDRTTDEAKKAQVNDTKALNLELIQKQNASSQNASEINKDKIKAVGRAKTASGEAGVAGISLDNLIGDFNRQESTYIDSLKYNLDIDSEAMNAKALGVNARAANRINGARGGIVAKPNMYQAALGIGSDTLQHGRDYRGWGTTT